MNRIRIVQLVNHLQIGGAEKHVLGIVRHLDRVRFEPYVFCLRERGVLAEEVESLGVPVKVIGNQTAKEMVLLPRLIQNLRNLRPLVIQSHLITPNFYGRVAGRLAGIPAIISTEHGLSPTKSNNQIRVDRMTARFADAIITVSEAVREIRLQRERLPADKLHTIYNFFENSKYQQPQDGNAVRAEFGVPFDTPLIGIIARLDPVKAIDMLLTALVEVKKHLPGTKLMIVGDGPVRGDLERTARQLGLADAVIFTGFRNDIPRLVWSFDVAVLCSYREALSTVLLEYMSAEKPVVATRVGGNPEVVLENETGLLVPPGEPEPLAAAILEILSDPERARTMGKLGRERAYTVFSVDTIVRQIEDLYIDLLAKKGKLPPSFSRRESRRIEAAGNRESS